MKYIITILTIWFSVLTCFGQNQSVSTRPDGTLNVSPTFFATNNLNTNTSFGVGLSGYQSGGVLYINAASNSITPVSLVSSSVITLNKNIINSAPKGEFSLVLTNDVTSFTIDMGTFNASDACIFVISVTGTNNFTFNPAVFPDLSNITFIQSPTIPNDWVFRKISGSSTFSVR